jgi:hypothetical protein
VAGDRSGIDSGGRHDQRADGGPVRLRAQRMRVDQPASTLPATMPTIMCGTRGSSRRDSTLTASVCTATPVT